MIIFAVFMQFVNRNVNLDAQQIISRMNNFKWYRRFSLERVKIRVDRILEFVDQFHKHYRNTWFNQINIVLRFTNSGKKNNKVWKICSKKRMNQSKYQSRVNVDKSREYSHFTSSLNSFRACKLCVCFHFIGFVLLCI